MSNALNHPMFDRKKKNERICTPNIISVLQAHCITPRTHLKKPKHPKTLCASDRKPILNLLSQLYNINIPQRALYITWSRQWHTHKKYLKKTPIPSILIEKLEDYVKKTSCHIAFVHHDLHPGNILIGKRSYLIDWEYAHHSAIEYDLAELSLWEPLHTEEYKILGYQPNTSTLEAAIILRLIFHLMWASFHDQKQTYIAPSIYPYDHVLKKSTTMPSEDVYPWIRVQSYPLICEKLAKHTLTKDHPFCA